MSASPSRLQQALARGRALVAYVTAGDPDLETSQRTVLEVARAGADVIELGVPFSDPTADGPVIQAAMQRALGGGATLGSVLELCARVRREIATPIVLFGYYNPIFVHGCARFAAAARTAGADGVLVVDLPPEEADELLLPLGAQGLDFIPLLAPTSTEERIGRALAVASGFVYYVSLTGVTGAALSDFAEADRRVGELRARTALPVAVGFGVRSPEDARRVGAFAHGVVVGSAIVKAIDEGGPTAAGALVVALKHALAEVPALS
jgi:tryptophan synthase alpha chain